MRTLFVVIAVLLFGLSLPRPTWAQTADPAPPAETQAIVPSPAEVIPSPSPDPAAIAPISEPQPAPAAAVAADTTTKNNGAPGLVFPRITVGMVLLYVNLPCALLCLVIAQKKRVSIVRWGLLGSAFGAFALIGVILDPGAVTNAPLGRPK